MGFFRTMRNSSAVYQLIDSAAVPRPPWGPDMWGEEAAVGLFTLDPFGLYLLPRGNSWTLFMTEGKVVIRAEEVASVRDNFSDVFNAFCSVLNAWCIAVYNDGKVAQAQAIALHLIAWASQVNDRNREVYLAQWAFPMRNREEVQEAIEAFESSLKDPALNQHSLAIASHMLAKAKERASLY